MPTRQQIEHAIHTHFDTWNKQDKSGWMANFAVDAVLEDPVGGPVKTGREGVEKSWDNSFKEGHFWTIEPVLMQICTNQAALHVRSKGSIDGKSIEVEGIEVYTIDDAGKIAYIRTYFNPPAGVALDPYYSQAACSPVTTKISS
ncbi:MAG: nuclear transport factor 2 family protein [Pseudomonadales bacterium]|jgi:steroid delta-isomerase|nr:nuclear transport factor 2 family protein [Gammaproteobacteria bacterium]MBK6581672.1 nuclear transport factor 2 family protein [Gammaproteobacteria bacterium]MBK7170137.1 nuclear transport factor 2 family protein [Gammaproteobacteria bacterium]MBK9664365.1 nuclear transport factor 2 family protein [Gammaproteobacteria bacterium]MBP6051325.1 nuclear transport factor 2 family protein [Pseudomonadales bacterium]